jgi:hypothetical protein
MLILVPYCIELCHFELINAVSSPSVNFINVLRTAFAHVDPEFVKDTVKSSVSFFGGGGIY